jgi:hypothetical protein
MDIPDEEVFGFGSLVFVLIRIFGHLMLQNPRPKTEDQRRSLSLPFYFWRDYDAALKLPIQEKQGIQ